MKIARVLAALLFAVAVVSPFTAQSADTGKKHTMVIHVTDNDEVKWNQALNNAGNLKKKYGKNIQVEIVVNGPGLKMMMFDSAVGNRMETAVKSGIDLMACGATMKAEKVEKKDLYPGVKVVPGGVAEIMEKQELGWSYIKI
jgi:intracellular sulfur oxidation DsrE/DsrF family protein